LCHFGVKHVVDEGLFLLWTQNLKRHLPALLFSEMGLGSLKLCKRAIFSLGAAQQDRANDALFGNSTLS